MKKVIVHFLPEWMNIISLIKCLKHERNIGKNISQYLKRRGYQLNYYEYLLIWKIYPRTFEKYIFSIHSHGKAYFYYFLQESLLDSLSRFSCIYEFHKNINYKTKYLFIWNKEWIDTIMKFLKDHFDLSKIFYGFLEYKKIIQSVPSNVYGYINTLFLIFLSESYNIIDIDKSILRLTLVSEWCSYRVSKSEWRTIYYNTSLKEISHFLDLIKEKTFENIFFITNNKNMNRRKINFFRDHFLVNNNTGIGVKTYKPFDFMDINYSKNNLFIVFEDSRVFLKNYLILGITEFFVLQNH